MDYSVLVAPPGAGTPTGNVTVTDGVDSCTATVADGTCSLAITTHGNRSLTARYAGDANFDLSISPPETHVVYGPPAVTGIDSLADTGDGRILENERTSANITQLFVHFNKDMTASNPAGNNDVLNQAKYSLARSGYPDMVINSCQLHQQRRRRALCSLLRR